MMRVSSWGRLGAEPHRVLALQDAARVASQIGGTHPGIAYGMGRSYGDVCLNPGGALWQTRGMDRFIDFDANTGVLRCEAGVTLGEIQALCMPRGWALPVVPGTQFVTVGGAIANDVHGKNHHREGSFGDHVRSLTLLRSDGSQRVCGPQQDSGWFDATVAGLGLTGLILDADLQLRRVDGPWLEGERIAFDDLQGFFVLADASEADWEHTVAWVDCLRGREGRGIFQRANAARDQSGAPPSKSGLRFPFTPPFSLVNSLSLRAFNTAYFHAQRWQSGPFRIDHAGFHHPLDHIREWNRLYGPRGFHQYQCVVPREAGEAAIKALLQQAARVGGGSFLAVLKTFGARRSRGLLGFPRPGVTLAMDFPHRGADTLALFQRLDAIVREAGGALYPAKDSRMPQEIFQSGFPRWREFLAYRDRGMDSAFARRVFANEFGG